MAYELNASNLLNPMVVWSDLGLRALDMTVSSSQNISESVDRLTRAGASVEPVPAVASTSMVSRQSEFAIPSGVALSADLQRSALDLMMQGWMQGWQQWMSALGTLASIAAGPGPSRSSKRQSDPLGATHAEGASLEHAFATSEPKRRRSASRAKAKSRRSRST
jgi:hypothetical protein